MNQVNLHVTADITLGVKHLRGRFEPAGGAKIPYLDDKNSYVVVIDSGEIALDMPSLNAMMAHTLGQNHSNVEKVQITINEEHQLQQKGVLDKGIPLGSGMGGSAASCVAALVAANHLLDVPLTREQLYPFALTGEAVASGGRHGDNIGPMLLGGLVLATENRLVCIPVPAQWHCVLVHPEAVLETRRAREALTGSYALHDFVAQSANLALVLAGCYSGDANLVRNGLKDVLVEPRRASLIVGFDAVKAAALACGAMGASISGAGPSVFAWFEGRVDAERAGAAMQAAFSDAGFDSQVYVSPIAGPRAEVLA